MQTFKKAPGGAGNSALDDEGITSLARPEVGSALSALKSKIKDNNSVASKQAIKQAVPQKEAKAVSRCGCW